MDSAPHLALYFYYACPYCQLVLSAIDDLGLDVELRDTLSDRSHREKLESDTGRRTVPCLYIDGKPMHESAEIVKWLRANASTLKKRD